MLSLTEGTGVGGCGACVGCAPVAPWSALASLGKLGSDIVTKDRVNVQVNQKIELLCCSRGGGSCVQSKCSQKMFNRNKLSQC